MKRATSLLCVLYLVLLACGWACIRLHTEVLWPVTLFLFAPRWVCLLPLLVLIPTAWKFAPRSLWACGLACLGLLPLLDFRIPAFPSPSTPTLNGTQKLASTGGRALRLVSYNLGEGEIDVERLVQLVREERIELVMLEESSGKEAQQLFGQLGWQHRREEQIAIGSAHELRDFKVIARQPAKNHGKSVAALACDLIWKPSGPRALDDRSVQAIRVVAVHLPTFRYALEVAQGLDFIAAGVALRDFGEQYDAIASQVAEIARSSPGPVVLGGDFNVPVDSIHYRRHWHTLTNAFSDRGWGLGYTKFTRFHGVRIDHVVTNAAFVCTSVRVGPNLGGDHHPLIVALELLEDQQMVTKIPPIKSQ